MPAKLFLFKLNISNEDCPQLYSYKRLFFQTDKDVYSCHIDS